MNRTSAEALSRNLLLSRWRQINRMSSTMKLNTGLLPHRLALALGRCLQQHDTPRPRSQKEIIEHLMCVCLRRGFEFDQRCRRQEVQLGPSPTINARQCKKTITSQWILTYKDEALSWVSGEVKCLQVQWTSSHAYWHCSGDEQTLLHHAERSHR